jgi:DedD protein
MDARAKQRLTGAVILVALFVLVVPALLTGPKSTSTSTPPDEEGMRSVTLDFNAPRTAQTEPPASVPAVSLPATPSATAPAEVAKPQSPSQPRPQPDTDQPAPAPATVTPAPQSVPARPAATPRAEAGNFVVQLGSFGVRENADRLVRDMKSKGFTAFITPTTTNGRQLYQVRVGPARDRASAEALAARLKREGQSGSIVPIS